MKRSAPQSVGLPESAGEKKQPRLVPSPDNRDRGHQPMPTRRTSRPRASPGSGMRRPSKAASRSSSTSSTPMPASRPASPSQDTTSARSAAVTPRNPAHSVTTKSWEPSATGMASGSASDLNQRHIATQKSLFIRIQYSDKRNLRQVQAFSKQVDPDKAIEFALSKISQNFYSF